MNRSIHTRLHVLTFCWELHKFYKGWVSQSNTGSSLHGGCLTQRDPLIEVCVILTYNYFLLKSVKQAHKNMKPADLHVTSGELVGANINRSPTSYLKNPDKERAQYKHDTDTTMTILKITDENKHDVGMIR